MKKQANPLSAYIVIGLAFIPLAITVNIAFIGPAVFFILVGAKAMRESRRPDQNDDDSTAT